MGQIGKFRGKKLNSAVLSFYGEYDHKVDLQGRISLPSRFKELFKGGIVLARGYDRNIDAWPFIEWEAYVKQVTAKLSLNLPKHRDMMRFHIGGAYHLDMDRQGRGLLPPRLREGAGIDEEVVLVGMGDHLEIWSRKLWEEKRDILDEDAATIAETLGDL